MKNNKVATYLLYALGEVILVVVGILVAVQIDTYVEQLNNRKLEQKLLTEIRNNLDSDLAEIEEDLQIMLELNQACEDINKYVKENEKPDQDFSVLASHIRVTPHFSPNESGYKLLLSKGLSLISNDTLRHEISDHYENLYTYYRRYEQERMSFNIAHVQPMIHQYFTVVSDLNQRFHMLFEITDEDFSKLRKDDKFMKIVSAKQMENTGVQLRAQRVKNNIINLTEKINNTLN